MKLEYLKEFVVLSKELNYSSAAARLFISQSALSRHISICSHEIIRRCGVVFRDVRYTRNIETVPAVLLKCNGIHIAGDRVKRQGFPGIRYVPIRDEEAFTYHCFAHRADNENRLLPIFINEAMHYFKDRAEA